MTCDASFQLRRGDEWASGQTSIRRPRHFLQFSYGDNRELKTGSAESLRYFYPPYQTSPQDEQMPPMYLGKGYDSANIVESDKSLNSLLATIMEHEKSKLAEGVPASEAKCEADVITWRGMVTRILTAIYDEYSDYEMNATLFQGTIYIEDNSEYESREAETKRTNPNQRRPNQARQEEMQYWGYKFEQLCTIPKPWGECTREEIEQRDEEHVNNSAQYCAIVRTGIGSTSFIIGGEVDCVKGAAPMAEEDKIHWVELKTSKDPEDVREHQLERSRQNFERKLCKFWAQSFLLGVPEIVIGYRDNSGYLYKIRHMETQRIPGYVKQSTGGWNGNVCINLAAAFYEWLKKTIDGREGVWRIARHKDKEFISITRLEDEGTGNILSREFKDHRERMFGSQQD